MRHINLDVHSPVSVFRIDIGLFSESMIFGNKKALGRISSPKGSVGEIRADADVSADCTSCGLPHTKRPEGIYTLRPLIDALLPIIQLAEISRQDLAQIQIAASMRLISLKTFRNVLRKRCASRISRNARLRHLLSFPYASDGSLPPKINRASVLVAAPESHVHRKVLAGNVPSGQI